MNGKRMAGSSPDAEHAAAGAASFTRKADGGAEVKPVALCRARIGPRR